MRLSIVRTDKKGVVHLSVKSAEWLMERIKTDTKAGDIARLREHVALFGHVKGSDMETKVARICPLAELAKTENGNIETRAFNGLIWLHVAGLMRKEDVEAVKENSKILPTTFAAFMGADGRSVEILVSVAKKGAKLPTTEAEMVRFCQRAYDVAVGIYDGVLAKTVERQAVHITDGFLMPLDGQPYFHPEATPLVVDDSLTVKRPGTATGEEWAEQREVDLELYGDYELVYRHAVEEAYEATAQKVGAAPVPAYSHEEAYITELARRLCQVGMPEEEAFLHISNHHAYRAAYNEYNFRAIVSAVYAEEKPSRQQGLATVAKDTRRMIAFLKSRYVFRYNTVMGYTEFRPNNTWIQDWQPCDENAINGMTLQARLSDLDVRDKDVRRYVHSDMIRRSDPVGDFLVKVSKAWDGETDHIAMLARQVPCDIPQWETWFKKWFVSMVAQWIMPRQEYGNAIVPLLISPQGDGKTSFCRMILPRELSWGFLENLDVSEKRATLQAMHNFLLINLDEFNQISPKIQEGFLKNVIQLPSVKIKRPYGKHVEEFKRYASFIATTNDMNVLSDPTGSRRFICVQLTAPINTSYKPNYEALYGQAYAIVMGNQMKWYFEADEVQAIMAHNRDYQLVPPAVNYFHEHFEVVQDEEEGTWLTVTAIYEHLRALVGSRLNVSGVNRFGRVLYNIEGIRRKRTKTGITYLVKEKA